MGSTLFGQAPKATFSTQPTIMPGQIDLLQSVANQIGTGPGMVAPWLESAIQGQAQGPVTQLQPQAFQTASTLMSGGTPQMADAISRLMNVDPSVSTRAFQEGVVGPVTSDFLTSTLPSIAGNYGRGAGGAFGSESAAARSNAATDVSRTLASEGSKYAFQGQQLQQQGLETGITDLLSAIGTGLGAVPGISTYPAQALNQLSNPILQFLQLLSGLATTPTLQTSGVGSGGSTGLIPGLLSNPGLGAAGGQFLTNLFKPS